MNKYNIFGYENNVDRERQVIGAHRMTSKYGEDFGQVAGLVVDKDGVPKGWDRIGNQQNVSMVNGSQE